MSQILKRPRFLLDLAEELNWLADKAGPDVADRTGDRENPAKANY